MIEVHDFDADGVIEISWWVVEREVAIFSDSCAGDVNRALREELLVPCAFGGGVGRFAADAVKCGGADVLEDVLLLVVPKTGGVIRADADVLVHMKDFNFGPVDGL